jgi:hypothetical protein
LNVKDILAYYSAEFITAVKKLMIQATVACAVKHFTAVIYSLGHGLRF